MDKEQISQKESIDAEAHPITEAAIAGQTEPEVSGLSDDAKRSLLKRLKERDSPVLATPDAHGPG